MQKKRRVLETFRLNRNRDYQVRFYRMVFGNLPAKPQKATLRRFLSVYLKALCKSPREPQRAGAFCRGPQQAPRSGLPVSGPFLSILDARKNFFGNLAGAGARGNAFEPVYLHS